MPSKSDPQARNATTGSVGAVLPLLTLVIVIALGAVGLDVAHNVTTRTAEQNATDAGALAGAAYITQNATGASDVLSSPPVAMDQATSFNQKTNAQVTGSNVTGNNTADGKAVSNANGCNVVATAFPPSAPTLTSTPYPGNNGQCQVNSSMTIRNMFASIIGRMTDNVPVASMATSYNTAVGINANQLFPIAVSLDSLGGHNVNDPDNLPLYLASIGSKETFTLTEPCANAAWTSFNILSAANQSVGPSETKQLNWIDSALSPFTGGSGTGPVPAQIVGEPNSSGTQPGGIDLWADLSSPTNFTASLPLVVNLPVMAGDQPYRLSTTQTPGSATTPTGPQTHPLLGFIGFKITKAVYGNDASTGLPELQYIQGTLVKTLVSGMPGVANPVVLPAGVTPPNDPTTGKTQTAANYIGKLQLALQNLSPGIVMLGTTNLNKGPNNQPEGTAGNGPIAVANTDVYYSGGGTTLAGKYQTVANSSLAGSNAATHILTPAGTLISATQTEPDLGGIGGDVVYSNVMVTPNTPFTLTAYFTDETGLSAVNSITAWDSTGTNNVTLSGPLTYGVVPTLPAIGYTQNQIPSSWQFPSGFSAQNYTSQITIGVPGLTQPIVLQMNTTDSDHGGDHGITLFDIQFPPCPVN